jgi:hypothetical protein
MQFSPKNPTLEARGVTRVLYADSICSGMPKSTQQGLRRINDSWSAGSRCGRGGVKKSQSHACVRTRRHKNLELVQGLRLDTLHFVSRVWLNFNSQEFFHLFEASSIQWQCWPFTGQSQRCSTRRQSKRQEGWVSGASCGLLELSSFETERGHFFWNFGITKLPCARSETPKRKNWKRFVKILSTGEGSTDLSGSVTDRRVRVLRCSRVRTKLSHIKGSET